ncbi:MAG: sialate O-acetylesterase [Akkermansiaceae bacterium]
MTPPTSGLAKFPILALFLLCLPALGLTVNVDFSRDVTSPITGSLPAALHASTGPAPDTGTYWNNYSVYMPATGGSDGADSIVNPYVVNNLTASDGTTATAIDVALTSNFYRAFNGTATINDLQQEWVFARLGNSATMTISGLDSALTYDFYLVGAGSFQTNYTIGTTTKTATGVNGTGGVWTAGTNYVLFSGVSPNTSGIITIGIQDGLAPIDGNGTIAAMQITSQGPASNFLYPASATSSVGQFNSSYAPSNLFNDGFSSPSSPISTETDYLAQDHNFASPAGTTQNFNLTFDLATSTAVDGMHVWNYAYRNGANGGTSPDYGVNSYTLTFYSGAGGSGTAIGTVFAGNLAAVPWNASNPAQTVNFGTTYQNARSVVMRVLSNHGGTFTGMNELAFRGIAAPNAIASFTASSAFVQRPATPTLSWQIDGEITSLEIASIGSVLANTTNGSGSIPVSPVGEKIYTLILNNSVQKTVSVIGLPPKEKLHIYLLIGQSNMQGEGNDGFNAALDAPDPRVLKFGSREGMESVFLTGGHRLTHLASNATENGMGLEFGKSLLAAEADPEVTICLINHALGSTAIQWWMPDVPDNVPNHARQYILYNEAIQRVTNASSYGVIKGVLWHQGEYNSNSGNATKTPPADPDGYAARLQVLVDNLRRDLTAQGLPFICGKFVPDFVSTQLAYRTSIEGALADLPNQRANTFCVENNGLSSNTADPIHFNAPSQRILGQRYAAAMNTFYSDPFRLYLGGFYPPAELLIPQNIDPAGDNDHDGYSNFLEFAFLTDPSKSEIVPPVNYSRITVPGEGDFPTITFRQRFDTEAPQYIVEVSTDLATWQSNLPGQLVTATVGSPIANGDGTSLVTVRSLRPVSSGSGSDFMRIRSTAP